MIVINSRIDKISKLLHGNEEKYGKTVFLETRSVSLFLDSSHSIDYYFVWN